MPICQRCGSDQNFVLKVVMISAALLTIRYFTAWSILAAWKLAAFVVKLNQELCLRSDCTRSNSATTRLSSDWNQLKASPRWDLWWCCWSPVLSDQVLSGIPCMEGGMLNTRCTSWKMYAVTQGFDLEK